LKKFCKEINLENFTSLKLISSTALHFKRQFAKLKRNFVKKLILKIYISKKLIAINGFTFCQLQIEKEILQKKLTSKLHQRLLNLRPKVAKLKRNFAKKLISKILHL
jgi:hypothetical protein